ncbi:dolichol-phosphate mannosyltransferase subunit 1 [Phtheirospermum japonicum]|uniref:Dolichol-phosphate mannosyltransferase subunit 1 n=1 Tax=Phtheirospermum japonicum TaxID=374723 RepID=A0A830C3R0_9LAMI|nr:dolichol-phosphate mannosyltransferase subunit 1 [Phtheirospermum japonicum]
MVHFGAYMEYCDIYDIPCILGSMGNSLCSDLTASLTSPERSSQQLARTRSRCGVRFGFTFSRSIFNFTREVESTVSSYEVSIWRSLWIDLFSQISVLSGAFVMVLWFFSLPATDIALGMIGSAMLKGLDQLMSMSSGSKGLENLHQHGCFGKDKISGIPFCDTCVYGKQQRVQFLVFPSPKIPACRDILEYVHADVCGPAKDPTQGGDRYFLSFPSVPLNGQCPEVVWCGKEIDYSNLRIFGCAVFVHQKLDKLEPRFVKCIFLGYSEGFKGYRLWLRSEPGFKVIISRDVIFNEFEFSCLPASVLVVNEPDPTPSEVEPMHVSKFDDSHDLPVETDNMHVDVIDDASNGLSAKNAQTSDVHVENVDNMHDTHVLDY